MKRTPILFCAALAALVLPSPARVSSRVKESVDPQTKLKTLAFEVRTFSCQAPTTNETNDAKVRLIFNAFQLSTGGADYAVVVDLTGGEFVHPGRRGTMETLMGGAHDQLLPAERIRKWSDHPWWGSREKREAIPFATDREWFEKAANAGELQFRVNAADRVLERCVSATELRDLHDFLGRAATL
jgi:hypothetical protein